MLLDQKLAIKITRDLPLEKEKSDFLRFVSTIGTVNHPRFCYNRSSNHPFAVEELETQPRIDVGHLDQ